MNLDSVVQVSKQQVSCDLGGEAAILNLTTGAYYGLDPVGARIWNFIATPKTVAEVRDAVLAAYDVDASRCTSDLFDLLGRLAAEGLIDICDEAVS